MTSTSGPGVDPAPLFDLVTGFPPDDAVDVTVPVPLSLALYMTMLESTGRASVVAVLRRIHIEQVRETARGLQARLAELGGPDLPEAARLRVTHIIEERVPRVNGLRPHTHMFVGATVRGPKGSRLAAVDRGKLAAMAHADMLTDHHDRLIAATTERCGLVWGDTAAGGREMTEPDWLVESTARLRDGEHACAGPWPREQILVGRQP